MNRKLIYVANIRLPTEKAHSIQIMKMCEAFSLQGMDVELVVPNKRNNLNVTEVFEYYGVKPIFKIKRISSIDLLGKRLRYGRMFYWIDFLTFFISLCGVSGAEPGTVVYTRDPMLLLPFRKKKYRLVTEIHSLPEGGFIFLNLLKRSHLVVTITGYLKKMVVEHGIRAETVVVAPDAVDIEAFDINSSKKELREELALPVDKKLIGYVGALKTMNMEKGVDAALRVLQSLDAETVLVLVGGHKTDVQMYKRLATEIGLPHDRVVFTGRVLPTLVPRYLKAFDVLIAPFPENTHYKYYMSPLKLFEYMASGVPIVISDLPSVREIVDETCVEFFSPGDEAGLMQGIQNTFENKELSKHRADKCLSLVQEYTWLKRAGKILAAVS